MIEDFNNISRPATHRQIKHEEYFMYVINVFIIFTYLEFMNENMPHTITHHIHTLTHHLASSATYLPAAAAAAASHLVSHVCVIMLTPGGLIIFIINYNLLVRLV